MPRTLTALSSVSLLLLLGNSHVAADPPSPPKPTTTPAVVKKAPPLSVKSTAKDIDAYVAYYQRLGYKVTDNQLLFDRKGKVSIFRFAAKRHNGRVDSSVTADINAETRKVTFSEDTYTTYPDKTK